MADDGDGRDGAVADAALVVTRVVGKGKEDRFRRWCDRVAADARAAPGHRGDVQLEQGGGLFHVIHRFHAEDDLRAWEGSDGYARLMEEGDRFSTPKCQRITGDRLVAHLPSDADMSKPKRFLMVWGSVLPVVVSVNLLLGLLPFTLPRLAQVVISSGIMVASQTWVIYPAVSRRFKPWVMRDGDGQARVDGA